MLRRIVLLAAISIAGCTTQVESTQASTGPEQQSTPRQELERLNGRIRAAGTLRPEELQRLLAAREEALSKLVKEDPRAALELALTDEELSRLAALSPNGAEHLERIGDWEGELEVVIVDSPDMTALRTDFSVMLDGVRHEVYFADSAPADLRSGLTLRARGVKVGQRLALEKATAASPMTARTTAGVCQTTGNQRSIVILVNQPGVPQPTLTAKEVEDVFFSSTQRSLTEFWREMSDGRTTTTGDVVGWYTLSRDYACSEYYAMRTEVLQKVDQDVDFTQYDRIFIVHPAPPQGCDYGGMGTVGCTTLTTGDGTIVASTSWLRSEYMRPIDYGAHLTTHEGGHNLGLRHASSRDFGTEALGPFRAPGTRDEYGDKFSAMGNWNLGHYASPHKRQLGWFEPEQVTDVDMVDGTFILSPYAASGGLKALKVRRGNYGQAWLWIEYRQPVGNYDNSLASQVFGGALIHYEDYSNGGLTHLLDFTPETSSWNDPALLPGTTGATWADPYSNLRLTVQSATAQGLTVSVAYEPIPCVRGQTELYMYALQEKGVPDWDAEFDVEVYNTDSQGCAPSTYDVTASVPTGWPFYAGGLPAQLVLEPGGYAGYTVSSVVPPDATPGLYTFQTTISREDETVQATESLEVVPPCSPTAPVVTLSPSDLSVVPGTDASFTVTITNQDPYACGWKYYTFASAEPQGWTTTFSPSSYSIGPGETGTVLMRKSVPPGTAVGSYPVDVQVKDGNVLLGSASATATVACNRSAPELSFDVTSRSANPGDQLTYRISLTNRDSQVCGASEFELGSILPASWLGGFSPTTATVEPGQTKLVTLTVSVPSTAKAGNFVVQADAGRAGVTEVSAQSTVMIPCYLAAPTVTFVPSSATVEAGGSVTYEVTVRNNDPEACATTAFGFTANVPSGWTSSLSALSKTMVPGATTTVSLTTTAPTTAVGSFTVGLSANRSGRPGGSGSATAVVTEAPIEVTLSGPLSSYKKNSTVPFTATVTRGTLPLASASVRFDLTLPGGSTTSATVSTNSLGQATWSYFASTRGSYSARATATSGTRSATSNTVSFSVK